MFSNFLKNTTMTNTSYTTTELSFKKIYSKIDLPVIELLLAGTLHYFVVDTGANSNIINSEVFEKYLDTPVLPDTNLVCLNGLRCQNKQSYITLKVNDQLFSDNFTISNFSEIFNIIEKENKIKLSGIIGTPFLGKYKALIDFGSKILKLNAVSSN